MLYRTTNFTFSSNAIRYTQKHNLAIAKLQSQISSGSKLTSASDDPIAFRRLGLLRETAATLNAQEETLQNAKSVLQASSDQLVQYGTLLTRAKVIAQQGVQALGDQERATLAAEIGGILGRVKDIANAKHGTNFLFGGSEQSKPPFHFSTADDGRSLGVQYQGFEAKSNIKISESIQLTGILDGRDVFQLQDRSETIYIGATGATAGQGTDSLVGRARLAVSNDTTTYLGASGIAPGTNTADDTIIGQVGTHELTIVDTAGDGSAGTIQLNDGQVISFSNSDTNLEVQGLQGEVVYVDTTSIAAGFNGTVSIEATGNISLDGVNSVSIDFTDAQQLSDSVSGNQIFVDTTSVVRAGTEKLEFGGANSVFQVLHDLKTDLENGRGLNADQVSDSIGRRLGELEALSVQAQDALGKQSASLATLDDFASQLSIHSVANESELVDVGATDITNAVLQLQNAQSLLQYTFAVSGRLSNLGLLEFLR